MPTGSVPGSGARAWYRADRDSVLDSGGMVLLIASDEEDARVTAMLMNAAHAAGVAQERERCAKVADALKLALMPVMYEDDYWWSECLACAAEGKSIAEIVHAKDCPLNKPPENRNVEEVESLAIRTGEGGVTPDGK